MRKFTYMSDLHLEMEVDEDWSKIVPLKERDILILAGDIGHPADPKLTSFLRYVKQMFNLVIYVPGNHEYYGSSLIKSNQLLTKICTDCGVHLLNKNILVINDYSGNRPIVIIGTTLWSHIPPEHYTTIAGYLNDYRQIENFTTITSSQLFEKNYQWLLAHIKHLSPSHQIVVVTHHAPLLTGTSNPKYEGKVTNYGFASDCSEIIESGVDCWVFGHTHHNTRLNHKGTLIVANQRGYPNETTLFDPNLYFSLG